MATPTGLFTATHWIVAVPGDAPSASGAAAAASSSSSSASATAADKFRTTIVETTGRQLCDVFPFEVPAMKVGTLDQLMTLSDEAAKADAFIEGVLKKAERQVAESYNAEGAAKVALLAAQGKKAEVIKALDMMMVSEGRVLKVHDWAARFKWDVSAWGGRDEALPDVLRRLLAAADKIDADVRAVSQVYQEKKTALVAAERKKSGNLMVAALEDVVTPQALAAAGCEWTPADSEYLASVVVVLAKAQEESFLAGYGDLDRESVPLGPEGRRESVRGSPVVPGSARRVAEDKDGYVLYVVIVLKKFSESFRAACRDKRFSVREFSYEPAQAGAIGRQVEQLQKEVTERLAQLKSESRRKYVEAVTVWFHVKAVRVFVESVLRFGLPVRFSSVLIKLRRQGGPQASADNAARLLQGVRATWKKVAGTSNHRAVEEAYDLRGGKQAGGSVPGGGDPVIPGVSDAAGGAATQNPFVLLDFDLKEDTGALGKSGS